MDPILIILIVAMVVLAPLCLWYGWHSAQQEFKAFKEHERLKEEGKSK